MYELKQYWFSSCEKNKKLLRLTKPDSGAALITSHEDVLHHLETLRGNEVRGGTSLVGCPLWDHSLLAFLTGVMLESRDHNIFQHLLRGHCLSWPIKAPRIWVETLNKRLSWRSSFLMLVAVQSVGPVLKWQSCRWNSGHFCFYIAFLHHSRAVSSFTLHKQHWLEVIHIHYAYCLHSTLTTWPYQTIEEASKYDLCLGVCSVTSAHSERG